MDKNFASEVSTMCNLSLSIVEEGLTKGREEGRLQEKKKTL